MPHSIYFIFLTSSTQSQTDLFKQTQSLKIIFYFLISNFESVKYSDVLTMDIDIKCFDGFPCRIWSMAWISARVFCFWSDCLQEPTVSIMDWSHVRDLWEINDVVILHPVNFWLWNTWRNAFQLQGFVFSDFHLLRNFWIQDSWRDYK